MSPPTSRSRATSFPSAASGLPAAGLAVAAEHVVDGASAWKGEHRDQLAAALADARLGKYDVPLVWALDRLDGEGVESALGLPRVGDLVI